MKNTTIQRTFSVSFKRQKVYELDHKLTSVTEISREYGITRSAVYKWLRKYSSHYQSATKVVVQMESEQEKTKKLQARIAELERVLGRKQMEVDYLNKLIELEGKRMGEDLKKKAGLPPWNGSESTD
jgi:transposase-like protein